MADFGFKVHILRANRTLFRDHIHLVETILNDRCKRNVTVKLANQLIRT
jgi:hypothetical protein